MRGGQGGRTAESACGPMQSHHHYWENSRQMPHDSAGKSQDSRAGERGKGVMQRERQCLPNSVPTTLDFRGSGNSKAPQT